LHLCSQEYEKVESLHKVIFIPRARNPSVKKGERQTVFRDLIQSGRESSSKDSTREREKNKTRGGICSFTVLKRARGGERKTGKKKIGGKELVSFILKKRVTTVVLRCGNR